MTVPTHLRSLQALELAVRSGSLKAAAEILQITPAAVGQRIKLLEDFLGVDLLTRGRSGTRPARVLETALPHLAAAFRELDTTAQLLDFQRVHELHIVADSDWAELWLLPRLPKFRQLHPNVRFCVNGVGDIPVRLGNADCEVRFAAPAEGGEEVLFHDYLTPVTSPENRLRTIVRPREDCLEGFPLLHLDCYNTDPEAIGWPEWIRRYGGRRTAPGRGIRYRKVVTALEAVYSSAGFMLCGLALAEAGLAAQKLSLAFPLAQGAWSGHAYCVSFRDGALRRSQTAEFRDWLLAEAAVTQRQLHDMVDDAESPSATAWGSSPP
jgi:LysR family glycine cleavage system transcriptional activator